MYSKFEYFKWGAKNHPGNPFYVLIVFMLIIAGLRNKDIAGGLIAASIFLVLFAVMYVVTSISVGKANDSIMKGGNDAQ